MATVNYSYIFGAYLDGGQTGTYVLHPVGGRYNDVSAVPSLGTTPPQSGNVQVLSKWIVASPPNYQLWMEIKNNSDESVYFDVNWLNVGY
jgi:hypothetical protein